MTASVRGQLGIAALLTAAGAASAAENLPPLRIDPGLLGAGTPISKSAPPEAPILPPLPAIAPVPAATTPSLAATPATPAILPPPKTGPAASQVPAPVAAKPPAKPAPQPVQQPAPQPEPRPQPAPAAIAPVAAPSRPEAAASAPATTRPLEVGEQPRVAPTHAAQVKPDPAPAAVAYKAVPHDPNAKAPIYITADRMSGTTDDVIVAEGNVELKQLDATLNADKVTYRQLDEETEAEGNVHLERPDGRISGPKMRMRIEESVGYLEQPNYSIQRQTTIKQQQRLTDKPLHPDMPDVTVPQRQMTTGTGTAERIDFEGEGHYRLRQASYSTCPAGDNQDWYAQISDLKLDYDREVGSGEDAKIVFKGMPILYAPSMSFSLNNQRKSGLLPATFGVNSRIGFQYLQPYYWNIAPNMDATLSTRLMSRRGLQLNGNFRYLDYNYAGSARFEYLPEDTVTGTDRGAYSVIHTQDFGAGLTGSLNINGASDDTYFTDLSNRIAVVSQGNLLRQGKLNYNAGWWSAGINVQSYQTLQDPNQPRTRIPYAREPQITLNAARPDLPNGLAFNLQGEYVDFTHPTATLGRRMTFYPQLSLPIQTTAFYVTPKIGVHSTSYDLQRQAAGTPDQLTRTLPIFSVDSGMTFERDVAWRGENLTQTLEPRIYYLYVPNRQQKLIPEFDTALADFNFAQIFSENRYMGGDRIGDANQVTAAVTSRLVDPSTGVELLRAMLGQRYYFTDQRVTLFGEPRRTSRDADLLGAFSGLIAPRTYLDTGVQYNPRDSRTERLNVSARYQPEIGKVLNAGYRYTRDLLDQVDISAQWPLGGGWSGIGRYNFSTKENRIIEGVAGFEYNADCWAIRGVLQRLSTTTATETTSFFIQLELRGFSNIGSNPSEILRRNIPGYGRNFGSGSESDTSYY